MTSRADFGRSGRAVWLLLGMALLAAVPRARAELRSLPFTYETGARGQYLFPEIMGGGAALFDADGDGDLDAFLVQGGDLGESSIGPAASDRLLRNDRGAWVDITEASGIHERAYGMGVVAGDVNGDGAVDLLVTNFGAEALWINGGDGTFREEAAARGIRDEAWTVSASFADLDGDSALDLYLVNYVAFSPAENPRCYAESSRRDYCGPGSFRPVADRLFRNRGDGRFEDVSAAAGITAAPQPGLGVVAADFDSDGRLDLYVANDGQANQLWLAKGDGSFRDEALLAGVALDRSGRPQGSMGVDVADFDRDGDEDLFVTNLNGETNALYAATGPALFEERSIELGLAAPSLPMTSFGTGFLDLDNDGWLDLTVASGEVHEIEAQRSRGERFPFAQRRQTFLSQQGRRFAEGPEDRLAIGRGAALGDVDNDGDTDVLFVDQGTPAELALTAAPASHAWIGVDLPGAPGRNVRLRLRHAREPDQLARPRTDGSYASARDPRVVFGLGTLAGGWSLTLERAGKARLRVENLPSRVYLRFPEGSLP